MTISFDESLPLAVRPGGAWGNWTTSLCCAGVTHHHSLCDLGECGPCNHHHNERAARDESQKKAR